VISKRFGHVGRQTVCTWLTPPKTTCIWQYLAKKDGTDVRQLASIPEVPWKLQFSPDGSRLRFDAYDAMRNVPWNNNNAEHAIKALADLRNVIGGTSSAKGIHEYLVLLSVCQTCKYKGVDFLEFVRSRERNVDSFAKQSKL
jgi:hypothetical protein